MNLLTAGFYLLWPMLTLAVLVNHNLGLAPPEVSLALYPVPLVLLALWAFYQWPVGQRRRLALPVGVLIFAGAGVAAQMPGQFTLAMVLSLCGYLAYLTWATQTVAAGQVRWLLLVPVMLGALLAGYQFWYVPAMIHEALVIYIALVTLFAMATILCSRVHWIAVPGVLFLALSEWIAGREAFLGGLENAGIYALLTGYAGHFLILHAPLWYQAPLTTPFGYALDHDDE